MIDTIWTCGLNCDAAMYSPLWLWHYYQQYLNSILATIWRNPRLSVLACTELLAHSFAFSNNVWNSLARLYGHKTCKSINLTLKLLEHELPMLWGHATARLETDISRTYQTSVPSEGQIHQDDICSSRILQSQSCTSLGRSEQVWC